MANTKVDTGLGEKDRADIAQGMARFLADTYTLYLKTQFFHWNVTGPQFNSLHKMFEAQYTELATMVDDVAERIRALGATAPGSFADFTRLKSIDEQQGVPPARDMVARLIEGRDAVIKTGRAVAARAEEANDQATLDLLGSVLRDHEKQAWMLRSLLDGWPEGAAQPA